MEVSKLRNVTVTLEEEVARWARVYAARHDTSVSQLLGAMLKERMTEEEGYEAARQEFLNRRPTLRTRGRLPNRDDLHDRPRLR